MSPFGLKFSQMILHTETSKLMYNWSFLFEVLHKPTLLPSTFNFVFTQAIQWWYSIRVILIVTSLISKLLYSWLFIDPSEHHYRAQTWKFYHFFNQASTMLNKVFNVFFSDQNLKEKENYTRSCRSIHNFCSCSFNICIYIVCWHLN